LISVIGYLSSFHRTQDQAEQQEKVAQELHLRWTVGGLRLALNDFIVLTILGRNICFWIVSEKTDKGIWQDKLWFYTFLIWKVWVLKKLKQSILTGFHVCHAPSPPNTTYDQESWNFGIRRHLGRLCLLRIYKLGILRVVPIRKVLDIFLLKPQGTVFIAWKWFHRVPRGRITKEKNCQIYYKDEIYWTKLRVQTST
jgi:hypothetical protein